MAGHQWPWALHDQLRQLADVRRPAIYAPEGGNPETRLHGFLRTRCCSGLTQLAITMKLHSFVIHCLTFMREGSLLTLFCMVTSDDAPEKSPGAWFGAWVNLHGVCWQRERETHTHTYYVCVYIYIHRHICAWQN